MLTKIKVVWGGAAITVLGALGAYLLGADWAAVLPVGVAPVVIAALGYIVPESNKALTEYLTMRGWYVPKDPA